MTTEEKIKQCTDEQTKIVESITKLIEAVKKYQQQIEQLRMMGVRLQGKIDAFKELEEENNARHEQSFDNDSNSDSNVIIDNYSDRNSPEPV